jgi:uncharacterized membrane protein YfcA
VHAEDVGSYLKEERMLSAITTLLISLAVVGAGFIGYWAKAIMGVRKDPSARNTPAGDTTHPGPVHIAIGAVTNFFDTLGIGSFATTTTIYRLRRLIDDRLIPGTLNVGHALPTVAQALIYTTIIEVDILTLITMIIASVLGAWLGAGIVSGWSRRKVRIGMGIALLAAATLMLMTQLKLFPAGGDTLGVRGALLAIALVGNFALGALMTLGIGLYAPCMILVSLLGMNPRAAFPIMMCSCAFLMPVGSMRFIRERKYSLRAALGLAIGGVPGVLLAAYIVKSLPLEVVRWMVIAIVVYTAIGLIRAGLRAEEVPAPAVPAV